MFTPIAMSYFDVICLSAIPVFILGFITYICYVNLSVDLELLKKDMSKRL